MERGPNIFSKTSGHGLSLLQNKTSASPFSGAGMPLRRKGSFDSIDSGLSTNDGSPRNRDPNEETLA